MSYIYPVAKKITQGFGGNAAYYKQYGQKGHNGIDLGVPLGTPVKASASGVIAFEGWGQQHSWMGSPAGICIIIRHGGLHSGYAHLTRTILNRGQTVKQGQVIGYSGRTGAATGPHVHFEMLPLSPNFGNGYAGRINPGPYVDAKPVAAKPRTFTVITTGPANVRSAPKISAPLAGSKRLPARAKFQAVGLVIGDSVSGNKRWFKSTSGHYVWSGNAKKI